MCPTSGIRISFLRQIRGVRGNVYEASPVAFYLEDGLSVDQLDLWLPARFTLPFGIPKYIERVSLSVVADVFSQSYKLVELEFV